MFWLVDEMLMNEWPNRLYYNYCERESNLTDDSRISMRPILLYM